MHGIEFLQDLAIVMLVAGVVTVLFHRFKQPVVLGYILAGVIIGPHTPPFPLIHGSETINTLAELGVILLMFALGLEFSLRKLKKVGASAFIAAFLEILLMLWVGYQVGRWFGWSKIDSIFLGAILSISSTTIIIKALNDLGKSKEQFAQLIFGILIIEDILGIAMIALLSGIAMTGTLSIVDVAVTLGKLGIFLVVVLVVGLLSVPRLIGYVASFRSNEMLLITVLGLCFGFSLLAVKLGYSVALGAFLIGAVLAETREIHRIETLIEPVRDMFSAIFFVTIGLMIDPRVITTHCFAILVITLAVVLGKVLTCSLGAFAAGNDTRSSLRVGMSLAQIGEFSFIIASLGLSLKVTSDFLYPIAVTVSALTTLLTPYLIKNADRLVAWFDRTAPARFVNYLGLYTEWISKAQKSSHPGMARKLIRRWTWQMSLNLVLVSALFVAASYLAQRKPALVTRFIGGNEGMDAILWATALFLSLPLIIATYRKLQALGLLLAELSLERVAKSRQTAAIKLIISHTVPVVGAFGIGLLILLLSSAILPSHAVLLPLLLIMAVVGVLLSRSMVKIYSKAQFALQETFARPAALARRPPAPLSQMLKNARIESFLIPEQSLAAGKLIREIALRKETGVTIVGIERNGESIISPGPDEELKAGDTIVLLGTEAQVQAAQTSLRLSDAPERGVRVRS